MVDDTPRCKICDAKLIFNNGQWVHDFWGSYEEDK